MTEAVESVVLDTETTGWSPKKGDRVIEIAAARFDPATGELREKFHHYVNPGFPIEEQATAVHGITNEMLADKPPFAAVAEDLANFVRGARVVIHNAPFDVGFLNAEFEQANKESFESLPEKVICSRRIARFVMPPQQPANLNALCDAFGIDRSVRTLHSALVDVALLAQVYSRLVPVAARREEAFASLLPFPRDAELPADKNMLGCAYTKIAQLIGLLKAEQERICEVIEPLLGGTDYEHRDFTATFSPEIRTAWDKVVKAHLKGVDLSKYIKTFDPKLTIKPTAARKGASLDAHQEEALASLLPFPRRAKLPADKDILGRAYTMIEQLVKQLEAEQSRIRAALKPLLGGVDYEHSEFTARFSPNTRTEWDEVVKDHLQKVDLTKYKTISKPRLSIKAA